MNDCRRVETLLSAYIERESSPAETRFIDGHLTACPACRERTAEVESLAKRLRFLPRIEARPGFTERVLADALERPVLGLETPVVPAPRSRWDGWTAGLAAAAAIAVLAVTLGPRLRPSASEPVAANGTAAAVAPQATEVAETELPRPEDVPVFRLDRLAPGIAAEAEGEPGTSLGTVQYVLEDWAERTPAGGSEVVLTRVRSGSGEPVVVTF